MTRQLTRLPEGELNKVLQRVSKRFHRIVPKEAALQWGQEKQFILALLKSKPDLQRCTGDSLYDALLQAGSMGLSFNPTKKLCYLIPRRLRRRREGESKAQYEASVPTIAYASPSYIGLAYLVASSGAAIWTRAEVVFNADRFRYLGPAREPDHEPTLDPKKRTEPQAKGVYAMTKLHNGDVLCEYIDKETVQRIRAMSEFPNGTMWNPTKLWTEGWKKAAIRRLLKSPIVSSDRVDTALEVMNKYEGAAETSGDDYIDLEADQVETITEDQANTIHAAFSDADLDAAKWVAKICEAMGISTIADLPADQFDEVMQRTRDAITRASQARGGNA